jgi:hypothetical protein
MNTNKEKRQISLLVSEDIAQKIFEKAKRTHRSTNGMINEILFEYFEKEKKK